jgi:hypothetical protein
MREVAIFLIVFGVLVALLAGIIWLLGGQFGLRFVDAWYLALIALVFLFPGVMNVHHIASPRSPEAGPLRLLALIRGVGMLFASSSCMVPMFTKGVPRSAVLWGAAIGMLMNFGTMLFEDRFKRRKWSLPRTER